MISKLIHDEYTDADIAVIEKQLNSRNVHISGILERCKYGYPMILFLNPKRIANGVEEVNYEALSNMIWLSCPYLNYEIHELENRGYIKKITDFINSERTMKTKMKDAHAQYYYLRKTVANSLREGLDEHGSVQALFQSGIGGINDIQYLKCLHMHYAHYRICPDNITGHIVYMLMNECIDCDDARCKRYTE